MSRDLVEIKDDLTVNTSDTSDDVNIPTNGVSEEQARPQEAINEMIDDNKYLEKQNKRERIRKNIYKIGLIIAIIIIIILLLKGCSKERNLTIRNTKIPELETSALIEQDIPVDETKSPRIDIPVIQSFIVSKAYPYKDLYNPETNKGRYYLQYSFTIDGESEPFYQSKLVEGGYKFSVNIGELLEVGEYQVHITTSTFEEGTLEPKSGDDHVISITVTE